MTLTADTTALSGSLRRLRRLNLLVGLAHLFQGILILILSNGFSIPVLATFQDGPPGTTPPAPRTLFEMPFAIVIAIFLFFAAADHLLMGFGRVRRWYERNLRNTVNYARWIEYSISSSLMVVLIAMLTGIVDFYALMALFGVNSSMILFGVLMERFNAHGSDRVDWWPFIFGSIAGIVPWAAVAVAIGGSVQEGNAVPGFVFGIFVSLFLFFNSFAVNQVLQYRQVGKWRDYLYGERAYILLSLGAKSALAWQVFGGTLAG
jgi:hypothetical protein